MSEFHVICTHPNASTTINGVAFKKLADREGVMTVEPVSREVAENFSRVPHYTVHPVGEVDDKNTAGDSGDVKPPADVVSPAVAAAVAAAGRGRGRPSNAELAARAAAQTGGAN